MFYSSIKKWHEFSLLRDGEPKIIVRIEGVATENGSPNVELCQITTIDITDLKKAIKDVEILARFPKENPNPVMRIQRRVL